MKQWITFSILKFKTTNGFLLKQLKKDLRLGKWYMSLFNVSKKFSKKKKSFPVSYTVTKSCNLFITFLFHGVPYLFSFISKNMCACSVTKSCPTLCDPTDCTSPGSSVHGISPGKNSGVDCPFLLQGIFPTQELHLCLLHCRWILYP